jgi:nitrite reductase/ring-hydroxylating ferredoxin subunit
MRARDSASTRVCALEDLPDAGEREGREFDVRPDGYAKLFLVRRGDEVFAYLNRCPHRGTPLNWVPDQFLDRERNHILCATHGALFRLEDGHCLAGPCAGDALDPVEIELRDGAVYLVGYSPEPVNGLEPINSPEPEEDKAG